MSETGPDIHYASYIGRLANGPLEGGLLNGMLLDSWECETQTWTEEMEDEFRLKSGYPLRQWLPAVFGYVVNDHETSLNRQNFRKAVARIHTSVYPHI